MENNNEAWVSLQWMPSRIPMQDALVAYFPEGVAIVDPPRPVYETRYYEDADGLKLVCPYDGGSFDSSIFHIEPGIWDTTCDHCDKCIPALTLCYVTKAGVFQVLCVKCYKKQVVHKLSLHKTIHWYIKHWFGNDDAA
jgi:hypothetical protein